MSKGEMGDSSNGVELQVANIDPGIDARDIRQVGCKYLQVFAEIIINKIAFPIVFRFLHLACCSW